MIRLPRNETWRYRLNTRPQISPSVLTLAMTLTSIFQGKFWKKPYFRNERTDWYWTKGMWVDHLWPWVGPFGDQAEVWGSTWSGSGWLQISAWRRLMWRHQIEKFSALLAFSVGNPPVTGRFPHQGQLRIALISFFYIRLNKQLSK